MSFLAVRAKMETTRIHIVCTGASPGAGITVGLGKLGKWPGSAA